MERRYQPPPHGVDMELRSVPITIGLLYREYEQELKAGTLNLGNAGCPCRRLPRDRWAVGTHADEGGSSVGAA